MKASHTALVVIAFLLLSPGLSADDRAVAHAYVVKARDLMRRGEADAAQSLLIDAVAFSPDYSEALFWLGKLYCSRQETTAPGIPLLERALKANTWSETPTAAAEEELANAYLRTRRFSEASRIYHRLRADRIITPALETARARAVFGAGDARGADLIFDAAVKTFPGDRAASVAYLMHLARQGSGSRAAALAERGRKEFPGELRFLYYKIILSQDKKEKLKLFEEYREQGGTDPAAALQVFNADNAVFQRALDFFYNHNGGRDVLLLEAANARLRNEKGRSEAFRKALGGWSGEKIVDADEDGFFEEKYYFKNNELERVLFDRNQDGAPEYEFYFEQGAPVRIARAAGPETMMVFVYNQYPRLSRVDVEGKDRIDRYDVIPDALPLAPIKAMPSLKDWRPRLTLAAGAVFPNLKSLARLSYSLTEEPADRKQPRRKWELFYGRRMVLHEDADYNSVYERTVVYNDQGIALRGLIDNDGDGFYEVREIYLKGSLSRLEYDENRDGKPEYRENADQTAKEWDVNGDGTSDIIERRTANGKTVWERTGFFRRGK